MVIPLRPMVTVLLPGSSSCLPPFSKRSPLMNVPASDAQVRSPNHNLQPIRQSPPCVQLPPLSIKPPLLSIHHDLQPLAQVSRISQHPCSQPWLV